MSEQEKELTKEEEIQAYFSGDLQKNAHDFEIYLKKSSNNVLFSVVNPPEMYYFVS